MARYTSENCVVLHFRELFLQKMFLLYFRNQFLKYAFKLLFPDCAKIKYLSL